MISARLAVGLMTAGAMPVFAGAPLPPRMLLLDATAVSDGFIAVGERGSIVKSNDSGATWRPVPAPTRATLTGISFALARGSSATQGWVVGHDAIILGSSDSGQTWTKQFQGENLQDSFLDVLAIDATRAIAIGAYGLCYTTSDAGKTWARRTVIEEDVHLNRLTLGPDGALYIAGERGTLLSSVNQGETWTPLRTAYGGSLYGVLPQTDGTLLAYGLEGRIFRSRDRGQSWAPVSAPQPALLASAVQTASGTIVLAGQARTLWVSRDAGATFEMAKQPPTTAIAELIPLGDRRLLAVGEAGATVFDIP